jgi:hypothetical protein
MRNPSIKVADGIAVTVRALFPDTSMPYIEITGTGESITTGIFQYSFAFLEPPYMYHDEQCEVGYIPCGAVLSRIEVGFCEDPEDDNPFSQMVVAEFYFWDSNGIEPLIIHSSYLGKANTEIIETTLPMPLGMTVN